MERQDGTIRKRMKRWESGPPVRFLTFSCHKGVPVFNAPAPRDHFASCLARARLKYAFRLIAWVVMPEHVHVILVPPRGEDDEPTMSAILTSIKQPVAQRAIRNYRTREPHKLEAIRTNAGEARVWQEGGGFDRNIRTADELQREIEYIHQNPVKRGLVQEPTQWEWSSARWYADQRGDSCGWGGRIEIDRSGVQW